MRYEIRALSFAEILDTAFRLVRNHARLLIGLPALVYVPLVLVQHWMLMPGSASGLSLQKAIWGVLWAVLILVVLPFIFIALTWAIGRVYVGAQPTFGGSLREARRLLVPAIGTSLLYTLLIGGIFLVMCLAVTVAVLMASNLPVAVVLAGVAFIAFIALCWFFLAYLLVWQVMMLEEVFGMRALARSRALMQGRKWRAFGLTFVSGLIVAVLGGVLQLAAHFVPFMGPVVVSLAQAVGIAYQTTVITLLYFDARSRAEAFDVEHLAGQVRGQLASTG